MALGEGLSADSTGPPFSGLRLGTCSSCLEVDRVLLGALWLFY